jgi:hypothetical protein
MDSAGNHIGNLTTFHPIKIGCKLASTTVINQVGKGAGEDDIYIRYALSYHGEFAIRWMCNATCTPFSS